MLSLGSPVFSKRKLKCLGHTIVQMQLSSVLTEVIYFRTLKETGSPDYINNLKL